VSPTEFQLRAALHEGEGQPLQAGAIIARAEAIQDRRRKRVTSLAAAAVVVGAVSAGGALLANTGSSERNASSAGSADSGAHRAASGPEARTPSLSVPIAPPNGLACPALPPDPGSPAAGSSARRAPLFDEPVASITACGYASSGPTDAERLVGSTLLTGANAEALVRSVNSASTEVIAIPCPAPLERHSLVLLAVDPHGTPAQPVVASLDCGGAITNGTAVRYGWTPPADLAALASRRSPGSLPTGTAEGGGTGAVRAPAPATTPAAEPDASGGSG
jgi:hypothetical protein